jgi:outer membrane protein assembly factor BamB
MNQLGLRSEVRAVFPVVYREGVFWCDETTIHGVELVGERQGQALWGHATALFTLDTPRPLPRLAHGAGLPACTVTIAEGRLFARLGRGVAPRAADLASGGTFSTLVALDLEREGDLLWTRKPEQCGVDVGNWAFEGTPLFHRGRLFVLLRKSAPQVTLQVVCLLPATGQVEWSKTLCTAASMLEDDLDEQHQLLLSASEGSLFCATQLGSVIALDARLGNIEWVARYPHVAPEHIVKLHHRQQLGPSPCVVADGLVLVAPTDSESVWAFQQSSGLRLWQKPIPGQARQCWGWREGGSLSPPISCGASIQKRAKPPGWPGARVPRPEPRAGACWPGEWSTGPATMRSWWWKPSRADSVATFPSLPITRPREAAAVGVRSRPGR